MSQTANTTVSTRADLERLWAEQRHPSFVPTHPAHRGGMAQFNSSVGMVSRATLASYLHPANSTVGEYPSFNEVLSSPASRLCGSLMIGRFIPGC